MKKYYFIFLMVLMGSGLSGQQGWEAGAWSGVAYYLGDLNTNYDLSRPGIGTGLVGRYNFNPRVAFRFGLNYSRVSADDQYSDNIYERARNLSFRSDIYDMGGRVEFNFMPFRHGSKTEFFTPYFFTGLGLFRFNPKAFYNGEWVELQPLGTEGQDIDAEYRLTSGNFQYGGGLKISLNYVWSINLEFGGHAVFTDYLDDVSGTYADKVYLRRLRGQRAVNLSDRSVSIPGFSDFNVGEAGRQRGDNTNKDSYYHIGIGVMYYFGQLKCPEVTRR
jgi:hypothetical protein